MAAVQFCRGVDTEEKVGQGRFNSARDNKIQSALDQVRLIDMHKNISGEPVIHRGQAAYDGGSVFESSWQMGQLYLTKGRLAFFQRQNEKSEIYVSAIKHVDLVERNWVPGKKTIQLCIVERKGGRERKSFFSMKDARSWRERIEKLIRSPI